MYNFRFIGNLEQRISEKGLSLESLGSAIDLKAETTHDLACGVGHAPLDKVCRIADELDVSVDYLAGRSYSPQILDRISPSDNKTEL